MAEGTDVVPDAVREFGWATQKAGIRFIQPAMLALSEVSGATIGGSRIPDATEVAARYSQMAQALSLFLTDVGYGTTALSYTSATVAWNYEHGDDSQQEQMNSVTSSFQPAPGTTSIQSQAAAEAARQAEQDRQQARIDHGLGNDRTDSTTPSGLTLTPAQARAVLAAQAAAGPAGEGPDPAAGIGGLSQTARQTLVNQTIENHRTEMTAASATYQAVEWGPDGTPTRYAFVAPDSPQEASGVREENTNSQGEYAEAQDWAEQEREDGFEATVTVDDDGDVHRDSTRYDTPTYSTSYGTQAPLPYSSPSVGGTR